MQFAPLVLRTIEEMPSWRYSKDKFGNSSFELLPLTYSLFRPIVIMTR